MQQKLLVNNKINSDYILLIDEHNVNLGKTHFDKAQKKASSLNMDVIQVGFDEENKIPVCKLADYSKMKYSQSKRKQARPKAKPQVVKEIMFRMRISDHDLEIKKTKIKKLISKSYKVKFGVEFYGREAMFKENAREKLKEHLRDFTDIAKYDNLQETEKSIYVTLNPV